MEPHYLHIATATSRSGYSRSNGEWGAAPGQHSTALQHREKGKREHKVAITSRKWDGTSLSPALPATAAGL